MAKTLGSIIKESRKKAGITLRAFASDLGVSAALLSLIETDRQVPSQELIVAAAIRLGADADQWCGLAGKLTPNAQKSLADLAAEDPQFFRTMVDRFGGLK